MDIEHNVKLGVLLAPVGKPNVVISVADIVKHSCLENSQWFEFEFVASKTAVLKIQHQHKQDNDPHTAVIIKNIEFFGISDPKFIWQGIYYPEYPIHYPDKISPLKAQDYLGWNGVYLLEFGVPVFAWMHRVQDLGWIYD